MQQVKCTVLSTGFACTILSMIAVLAVETFLTIIYLHFEGHPLGMLCPGRNASMIVLLKIRKKQNSDSFPRSAGVPQWPECFNDRLAKDLKEAKL